MTTFLAVVGDMHINSAVGLCPPTFTRDDGQTVVASKTQAQVWAWWVEFWQWAKARSGAAPLYGIFNGDLLDINRHSGFQLLEADNPDVVLDLAQAALAPALAVCAGGFVIRGTEAHTGGSGWLEERLAHEIEAIPDDEHGTDSWWALPLTCEGVHLFITHHPGTNSMRPWTMGGGANRAAAMLSAAYYGEDWRPHLAIFNHVHHNEDSHDNHPVRAIFNRSWTFAGAYDHRQGRGSFASAVGGLLVECSGGEYVVEKFKRELPRPQVKQL